MTTFFTTEYVSGKPVASDDIEKVGWFEIRDINKFLVDEHQKLGRLLGNK